MKELIGIAQLDDSGGRHRNYHFKYRLFFDDGYHTQKPLGTVEKHKISQFDRDFSRDNPNYCAFFNLMQGDLRKKLGEL
jgi:hypothetical protein